MQVRIGVADAAREIELDVDDVDALAARIEEALNASAPAFVWAVDTKGRRVGIPAGRIAYLEIQADERSNVGFSA
ncbi:MAG: DUF3107 domain-containing protein [Acidimicrobiia bacterium]|nr:DUF3107 domain-containing protein [Acidimicrobiia bacterium]